jgi:hypothetical protein
VIVDLYVYTNQVPVIMPPPVGQIHFPGMHQGVPITLACLLLTPLGFYGRRKLRQLRKNGSLMTLALLVCTGIATLTLTSCNGIFAGTTPPGTYTITVMGTLSTGTVSGTNYSSTATVTMTVQ